jgi:hypothetical protein
MTLQTGGGRSFVYTKKTHPLKENTNDCTLHIPHPSHPFSGL